MREPVRKTLLFITAFQYGRIYPLMPAELDLMFRPGDRHCVYVRGRELHDTTVSIVGITLQHRRMSESMDFADGCHGGVCIDVRRGRCCAVFSSL